MTNYTSGVPLAVCVHVIATLRHGGNEALAKALIEHWPEPMRHVVVVLGDQDGPMAAEFEAIAELVRIPSGWPISLGILSETQDFIRLLSPRSVVSYTFSLPALPLCWIARLQGVQRVVMRVGNPPPVQPRMRRKWTGLIGLCRMARLPLVSCSTAVHDQMAHLSCLPAGSAPLLNGCDVDAIANRAETARRLRPAGDHKRVLMVARLDPIQKDYITLLKAFTTARVHGWQLQLVGDGPDRPRLEALASELGMDPAQVFLGSRSDIPELLGQADLFAFSTTTAEGFGIVLIEAMAAGLPIIASDVPACREVLLDGAAGVLLPPGDVSAWAERLKGLMASDYHRGILAEMARSHCDRYDIRITAERWCRLLSADTP